MENKFCICRMMVNSGDMAPRLWICEIHGKTGVMLIMGIINDIAVKKGLSRNNAWDLAENFRQSKISSCKLENKIYFDEDYFEDDLRSEFLNDEPKKSVFDYYKEHVQSESLFQKVKNLFKV